MAPGPAADEGHVDALTGVLTKEGFFRAFTPLAHIAQRNTFTVGVLAMEIEDFEEFRRIHDEESALGLLRAVAGIIRSHLRASDIVCRCDEKEFLVFLPQVEEGAVLKIAQAIQTYVMVDTLKDTPASIAVGGAQGTLDRDMDKRIKELIEAAQGNLRSAKVSGEHKPVVSEA
jgi:diguanylate cyclase (GGDEF)-like protein